MPGTFDEMIALAALCQALVATLCRELERGLTTPPLPTYLIEENKWRAMRWGLDAEVFDFVQGRRLSMRQAIGELLDFVDGVLDDLGTRREINSLRALLTNARGTGADRQIAVYQHYPHLQAVFARLVSDLNQHPATVQGTDPQTGKPASAVITGDDAVNGLRNALYDTSVIPALPRLIYQIANHNYSQLAAVSEAVNATLGSDSVGMFYSVECSESNLTPQDMLAAVQMVEPETRHYFLTSLQNIYANCQLWHVQPVPAAQWQPVTSAIPTLILAGEYDPATPPSYGMLAAQTLFRSYFFLFPGIGHGVVGRDSCATIMFRSFLEFPTQKPDTSCMSEVGEPLFE